MSKLRPKLPTFHFRVRYPARCDCNVEVDWVDIQAKDAKTAELKARAHFAKKLNIALLSVTPS